METANPTQLLCAQCGEPSPVDAAACVTCGQDPLLDGRYRLDALIGRGAMGVTFRATRLSDGVAIAAKELPLHRVDSLKTTELFQREANVLRSLSHPSIPAWVDHFTTGSGKQMALWILQEFIDGDTLQALAATNRPDERAVLLALKDLFATLIYLGDLRPPVIHRDLKPQNMMRRRVDNSFVLIDFGSVRDAVRDSLAGGSTVAGTFGYMAPEQFAGDATSATDVYGAGATALALLAGVGPERLFDADGKLDWQSRVVMSSELRGLLNRMLAPNPAHRPTPRAAADLVDALVAGPAPTPMGPPTTPRGPAKAAYRKPPMPAAPGKSTTIWWGTAIIVLAVGYMAADATGFLSTPTPVAAAGRWTPKGTLPFVAPPLGLEFGMSQEAAKAIWPQLASATPLPPELKGGVSLIESNYTPPNIVMPARGGYLSGVAYNAAAQIEGVDASCHVRFDTSGGSSQGLISFRCDMFFEDPARSDDMSRTLQSRWKARFGLPMGAQSPSGSAGSSTSYRASNDGGTLVGRWSSADAYIDLIKHKHSVRLQGERVD